MGLHNEAGISQGNLDLHKREDWFRAGIGDRIAFLQEYIDALEHFLVEKGFEKAKELKLQRILLGNGVEAVALSGNGVEIPGNFYEVQKGNYHDIDVTPILAFAANDYPTEARKLIVYEKLMRREIERASQS